MTLWTRLALLLVASLALPFASHAQTISGVGGSGAQSAVRSTGGGNQYMLGGTAMFLNSEAEQDGELLPGGTTVYSQLNAQINLVSYLMGFGILYQQDRIGPHQTNHGLAVKGEFTVGGFYMELGYGSAVQTFSERAVSSRSGTQLLYGGGIRVPAIFEFVYFDAGIRNRATTYTKQNGAQMKAPLRESLLMPFIGGGISL